MFKESKGSMFLTFLLSMLFGLLLLFVPEALLKTINYLIVSIFLIIGVIELISFFMSKSYKHEIYNSLIVGIICIWISLFVYVYYGSLIIILPVILSLYAFVIGGITLTKYLRKRDIMYIILSVLSFIMGILLLFKPILSLTLYFQIAGLYLIITSFIFLLEMKK